MAASHVILHIPHSSTHIPDEELDLYTVSRERLERENLSLADLHTDELYSLDGAARAIFPLSRFCVDAERFSDDAQEPMAARGMGVLYTAGVDLSPIRPVIPASRRKHLLDTYYWPHHNALDALAKERLEKFGQCLIFDCHSYPSRALPYELENCTLPRPEIGIGTDPFHTPAYIRDRIAAAFEAAGYEVGLDTPFTGALVPNAFYGRDKRVMGVMMEVRRDLYMDEVTGRRNSGFAKVSGDIARIMQDVAAQSLKNPV